MLRQTSVRAVRVYQREQRHLHPHAVLGLVEDDGLRAVDHRIGDLLTTVRREAMHHPRASRRACQESVVDLQASEILATPLLGIIPESQDVLRASNVGSPVTLNNAASAPARAYIDAVRRLMGETVTMMVPVERKGLMNRLLGRRAA